MSNKTFKRPNVQAFEALLRLRVNRFLQEDFCGVALVLVALDSLSRRRPKHTVQPPRRRRMRETKVIQKAV